jgi:rifampicin phosphotransferase
MDWQPLKTFDDPSVPKLDNLRRAARVGLRVPPTWWLPGAITKSVSPPQGGTAWPLIVRSGSPTEDQHATSNAGQFVSLIAETPEDFSLQVAQVVAALPRDAQGKPLGVLFVQSFLTGVEAGVAFFDGFYYERTTAADSNLDLTSGRKRGDVQRGHLMRDDPWSAWLLRLNAAFRRHMERIDIEYVRDDAGFVLLQARPALFPVKRNQTLSLANVKETMGELPSPWTKSALVDVGRTMPLLGEILPEVRNWDDPLLIELGGRLWNNVTPWFRLADQVGVPRAAVTDTLGGECNRPADRVYRVGRLLLSLPRVGLGGLRVLRHTWRTKSALQVLDAKIEAAEGLIGLSEATRAGMDVLIVQAASIVSLLILVSRFRRLLRLTGRSRVVTHEMMIEYRALSAIIDPTDRARGLDDWLKRYGHRGPEESDLARPRFAEMRDVLLHDLATACSGEHDAPRPWSFRDWLLQPLYWLDHRREWFRDAIMRRWQRLRERLLEEGLRLVAAGELDVPEDVFWLRGSELQTKAPLRSAVAAERQQFEALRQVRLPVDATRDEIEAILAKVEQPTTPSRILTRFPGIALVPAVLEGVVFRADNLLQVLSDRSPNGQRFGRTTILVVPALEPAWAVLFPRIGGVIAEVGGELSHASILLREMRRPAIVNCAGICTHVHTGDRVRLDGVRGVVEVLAANGDASPGLATPGL